MELDAHFRGARRLEEGRGRVAVEAKLGVHGVVAHDDAVPARERDHCGEELSARHGGGWIIRVVEIHELGPPRHVRGNRVEVGQEAVLPPKRHEMHLAAREPCSRRVDRVSGVGDQDYTPS